MNYIQIITMGIFGKTSWKITYERMRTLSNRNIIFGINKPKKFYEKKYSS